MLTQSRWNRLLALALVLPLAACAGEEEPDVEVEDDPMGMEPAPAPGGDMGTQPTMITLEATNNSGVTGEATARHTADSVTVEARISGASQDGEYPAHIHSGSCPSPGGVIAPLTAVQVSGGSGTSTTTIAASRVPEGEDAAVQIHQPGGQPVACGDMRGHGDMGDTPPSGM